MLASIFRLKDMNLEPQLVDQEDVDGLIFLCLSTQKRSMDYHQLI